MAVCVVVVVVVTIIVVVVVCGAAVVDVVAVSISVFGVSTITEVTKKAVDNAVTVVEVVTGTVVVVQGGVVSIQEQAVLTTLGRRIVSAANVCEH